MSLSLPVIPAHCRWALCIQVILVRALQVCTGVPQCHLALPYLLLELSVGSLPAPGELHPSRCFPKNLFLPLQPCRCAQVSSSWCPWMCCSHRTRIPGAPATPCAAPQVLPAHLCSFWLRASPDWSDWHGFRFCRCGFSRVTWTHLCFSPCWGSGVCFGVKLLISGAFPCFLVAAR